MEPNLETKMEEFITTGKETLKNVNKTVGVLKWLFGAILAIVLVVTIDTRVDLESKANTIDVRHSYMSKKDAMIIHDAEHQYYSNKFLEDTLSTYIGDMPDIKRILELN